MEIPYVPYEKTARYTPLPRPAAIKLLFYGITAIRPVFIIESLQLKLA